MSASELSYRRLDAAAPHDRAELARLILDVFDLDVTPLDRLGHDPSTVSFGWWRGGDLVANVSLFRQALWLDGRGVEAFGLQSVAVRPPWRGRGLFRDLMGRALAHADARAELVLLATETPALYHDYGFTTLVESSFKGRLTPMGAEPNHHRLSLDDGGDVALLRALFARRTPVSLVCGTCEDPALFLLKAVESPDIALVHLPDLDAIVAVEDHRPGILTLLDVVAPRIPPLAAIAAALGSPARRAHVFVTPDRLAWTPTRIVPEYGGTMVRGPFPTFDRPIMLSPMRV